MKILFISEFLIDKNGAITGGDEARTYYTAKYLAKFGHDISIITSLLPGTKKYEISDGFKIYRVGKVRPYIQSGDLLNRLLNFPLGVLWQGLKLDFDIVDGNSVSACPLALILGRLKGKKVIFWSPDIVGDDWQKAVGNLMGWVAKTIERAYVIFSPDKFIALSNTTQEKLHKLGVTKNKITVIYPGVIRTTAHKPHKTVTIISINRLVKYKHNDLVIKALPDGVIYKIIGDGPELANLKNLGQGKKVQFLGNLPHEKVLQALKSADIFCLASEVEGFGIVTLEAMSFGLPFINSDIPVHREIQEASQAGLLFTDDLKEKIELLTKDKNLYQKLSNNALSFAKAHTWDKMARQYEDLLSH